ncbi:hypothetical protein PRBEI_2000973200 [Prionailurus iriomotensis]
MKYLPFSAQVIFPVSVEARKSKFVVIKSNSWSIPGQ